MAHIQALLDNLNYTLHCKRSAVEVSRKFDALIKALVDYNKTHDQQIAVRRISGGYILTETI